MLERNLKEISMTVQSRVLPEWPEWQSEETAARYLDTSPNTLNAWRTRGKAPQPARRAPGVLGSGPTVAPEHPKPHWLTRSAKVGL